MGSRIRGVQFYPVPSEMPLVIRESRNKSGFKMNMYVGRETIGFKYRDVLGQFAKDSGLANLVIKIADFTDMTHVVACIAVYCRWNFAMTKSVNRVTLEEEIYRNAKTDIRHFLSMSKNSSASCLLIEGTYGKHCEIKIFLPDRRCHHHQKHLNKPNHSAANAAQQPSITYYHANTKWTIEKI